MSLDGADTLSFWRGQAAVCQAQLASAAADAADAPPTEAMLLPPIGRPDIEHTTFYSSGHTLRLRALAEQPLLFIAEHSLIRVEIALVSGEKVILILKPDKIQEHPLLSGTVYETFIHYGFYSKEVAEKLTAGEVGAPLFATDVEEVIFYSGQAFGESLEPEAVDLNLRPEQIKQIIYVGTEGLRLVLELKDKK